MENATEAFKMGFAVLVFVAALSLAIFSFTKVRETSANLIKQSDIKEYYQSLALDATGVSSNNALSSRVVGVETVVPTLYRYYKENYTILFYTGEGYDESNGTFTSITPMILYYTETSNSPDYSYLDQSTLTVSSSHDKRGIYGFDIQDEQVRREPWSASQETAYNFIKEFVTGVANENKQRYYSSRIDVAANRSGRNEYGEDDNGPFYTIDFLFNNNIIGENGRFNRKARLFVCGKIW